MSISVLTLSPSTSPSPEVVSSLHPTPSSPKELEYSFSVPHSIARFWYIIRDVNLTMLLCPDFFFPLIITKGKDTWGIGTEFLGKTTSLATFKGTCVKYKSFPQIKQLSWFVESESDVQKCMHFEYTLYKVTENDSSVLLITIRTQCTQMLVNVEMFFAKENFFEKMIERINLLMHQSSLSLFQFEGAVIDSDMESVWKFLTHFDILKKIAPLIPLDGDCSSQCVPQKIEEEAVLFYNNHKSFITIKTVKYDKRDNWNKWVLMYVVKDSFPFIPKIETLITVNKINEDECHISWFNDFKEPAPYDLVKQLSHMKKYILKLIQDFLENYNPKIIEEEYKCSIAKSSDSDVRLENDNKAN